MSRTTLDTRILFFENLELLMEKDEDVHFLTGDLGYPFMHNIERRFPTRFLNCGIAEQNMVGVAAGMARAGKKPFVYSGAIFLLYRAIEQIRDDIAYPKLDVKLVGTGAAGFLGFTHNFAESEDPKLIATRIPHLIYAEPREPHAMSATLKLKGPLFIRL